MPEPASDSPPPALLMRRMSHPVVIGPQSLSRDSAAPARRFALESGRAELVVRLDGEPAAGESIQWTQNGTPIDGQTGSALRLANLTPGDTDLYFAEIATPAGRTRSQAFVVAVYPSQSLRNQSARGRVAPEQPLTVGFVIGRESGPLRPRRYLLRVIGPSLTRFGVAKPLAQPSVGLSRRGTNCESLLQRDPALLAAATQAAGAFSLNADAGDFAALADLPPGVYSLTVTASGDVTGEVLAEIFEIPG